jgi:H+/Cl- antiporter ClcA/PII-like signaling protein
LIFRLHLSTVCAQLLTLLRWSLIILPMAALVGSACAAFLWALDAATRLRFEFPWLLWGLPVAGMMIGWIYWKLGRPAEAGNNLIVDQIHEPGAGIPRRMAPLILIATVVTHLFGGSAGREGTAVQMGGSVASSIGKLFRLDPAETRLMLMGGIAAGFGAVFGTPIAGAVFALEVLSVGRIQYEAVLPCLIAALGGDWVCQAWGIEHTAYAIAIPASFHLDPLLLGKVVMAGVVFGLGGLLFAELTHSVSGLARRFCPLPWLRPGIGGVLVIALVYAFGTRDYLGLGILAEGPGSVTIPALFEAGNIHPWAWASKLLFTVVTLGTGYKGGEVTPLFFIGAALGNALSGLLNAPTDLMAGLGFVAIFAAAANTPLACILMGIELFGAGQTPYIAVACFVAYAFSGHSGIYLAQRLAIPKVSTGDFGPDIALRQIRSAPPAMQPFTRISFLSRPSSQPSATNDQERSPMTFKHNVTAKEVGMVRIYLKPGEKRRGTGKFASLFPKPLYRELVLAAKAAGIVNAVAHHTHYGFSNHGGIEHGNAEIGNPDLTLCVELIGSREQLESFCRHQGENLRNKVVVYKHIEHWHILGVEADAGLPEAVAATA